MWLDLDVQIYPCPPGGTRFREGRGPFPLLFDAGEPVRGSSQIVRHLAERYGGGPIPWPLRLGPLTTATTALASALLPRVRALRPPSSARPPARPLELFADESSAAARHVRSWLCALELPYRWRTAGLGSAKLAELHARTGPGPLPVLFDGDLVLRGADPAVQHLRRVHG